MNQKTHQTASSVLGQIEHLHQSYCRLTGQNLALRFDRERLWFEFLRAGFTLADAVQVVRYLQKEIRHTRPINHDSIALLDYREHLRPERPDYHDNLLPEYLEPEQYFRRILAARRG